MKETVCEICKEMREDERMYLDDMAVCIDCYEKAVEE